MSTDRVTK